MRRTTIGKQPLNLLDEHTADLDTKDDPNWRMQIHRDAEYDIELWHGVLIGNQDNTEFAVVTGPPEVPHMQNSYTICGRAIQGDDKGRCNRLCKNFG